MAYPLQATEVGCASILLLRKLGLFGQDREVAILPSSGPHKDLFDPQTYGRFLFGTDARNMRWPFSRRGIVDHRLGAVNPNDLEFKLDEKDVNLEIKAKRLHFGLLED
jgi:hypothetical protein